MEVTKSRSSAYERITTALLQRDPRHSGNDYVCPAHKDNHPSLGVSQSNGKVLINCSAGCETKEVLAAIGMKMSDLYDRRNGKSSQKAVKTVEPLPTEANIKEWTDALWDDARLLRYLTDDRLVAEDVLEKYEIGYDKARRMYTIPFRDAGGQLLNVRWYGRPKTGEKATRFLVVGRDTKFLWPPDQLDAKTVVVAEGEFDTLAAISHDIPAVTGILGAGAGKWRHEWAMHFLGKKVPIATDCDKAGRDYAHQAAESLAGHANIVWLVDLAADRDDGYDLSDWFRDGGDRETFAELIVASQVQTPHRLQVVSAWERWERMQTSHRCVGNSRSVSCGLLRHSWCALEDGQVVGHGGDGCRGGQLDRPLGTLAV